MEYEDLKVPHQEAVAVMSELNQMLNDMQPFYVQRYQIWIAERAVTIAVFALAYRMDAGSLLSRSSITRSNLSSIQMWLRHDHV